MYTFQGHNTEHILQTTRLEPYTAQDNLQIQYKNEFSNMFVNLFL